MIHAESIRLEHSRFKALSSRACDLLATEGVRARPWRGEDLPHFGRLHDGAQIELNHFLELYVQVIAEASRDKRSIMNSTKSMFNRFLALSGLTVAADLDGEMRDGDFLAVYNRDQQMIYLSPNHLHYMSYSLEDLYCRPWMSMFRRNEFIEKILFGRAYEFLTARCRSTRFNLDIPPHVIYEVDSPEKRSATCQCRLHSPVFRDGEMIGFVSINNPLFAMSKLLPR